MLTITVDGKEKKLNIGCRTFVSLDVLLDVLGVAKQDVNLNGESISAAVLGGATVKGGDVLLLS